MTIKCKKHSPAPAANSGFSLIADEKLLAIYAAMLKCRMIAERARVLLTVNNLNGHSGAGQEAIAAAVGIDLRPEDTVRAVSGTLIHLFVKGLPLKQLFARQLNGAGPAMSLARQLKAATEDGITCKANKNGGIAAIFCDSESTHHDSWAEALTIAGAQRLPIIFVSQCTNRLASSDPRSNGGGGKLKAKTYGFPVIAVEGNDAVAVYRVACEAIAHARKGDGPTLIECQCWQAGDPLLNMEKYLERNGLFSESFKWQVECGVQE